MFERFTRGWAIAKQSAAVLRSNSSLLVFPIISAAVLVVVTTVLVVPLVLGLAAAVGMELSDNAMKVLGGIALFVWYFLCTFVIVFCNAALVACVLQSFRGQQPTIGSGLAAAWSRRSAILRWSFLAASVGVAIRGMQAVLRDKFGVWGDVTEGVADAAWAVASYFVLPVVVTEGLGPINAIKRSGAILKRTWGESLMGSAGIGAILILFLLPLFGLGALLASSAIGATTASVIGAVAVVYIVVIMLVFSVLNTIFRAAVYHYAMTGSAPADMDPGTLQAAFRSR